ncbi:hypothetical protein IAR50_006143 [Cryptococcus sp. DSM 104548]
MPSPTMSPPPSSPPCTLDPPFRGYIESTFDALLVFEAARRGMIPRVTRRLIERERGMVQSGAVFVFDEHESGIKRWTDGLVWSPSRILGNFLVYRETDKRSSSKASNSPTQTSPSSTTGTLARPTSSSANPNPHKFEAQAVLPHINTSLAEAAGAGSNGEPSPLGQGALARPRSSSEGGGNMDRQKERQLVGSLTNSYKFKEGGLVKKTMSVSVNGFAQHVVSYYAIDDVINGKLRSPSSIPELASLEISAEYLQKQNFRFPPQVEVGQDGIPRYRGEPEEPTSPHTPATGFPFQTYQQQPAAGDYYDPVNAYLPQHHQIPRMSSPRSRPVSVPMLVPLPSPAHSMQGSSYMGPSSAGSGTFYSESPSVNGMSYAPPLARQNSGSSVTSNGSAIRPGSGASRRYTPYGGAGNRNSTGSSVGYQVHARRTSDGSQNSPYSPDASYDIKPNPSPYYHTPNTAPSTFSSFYPPPPEGGAHHMEQMASPTYPGYAPWQIHPSQGGQGQTSRLIPTRPEYAAPPSLGPPPPGHGHHHLHPPSSSGSGDSASSDVPPPLHTMHTPHHRHAPSHHGGQGQGGQELQREWSHQSQGNVPHAPGWEGMGVGTGTPSPEYVVPIHQQHEEWRQGTGTMA